MIDLVLSQGALNDLASSAARAWSMLPLAFCSSSIACCLENPYEVSLEMVCSGKVEDAAPVVVGLLELVPGLAVVKYNMNRYLKSYKIDWFK